jgi:MoaA/NifB/PqqE/SkfB family radical SAM enzyme
METRPGASQQEKFRSLRSIDVYLNYDCNLRCSHCFVGDQLEYRTRLGWTSLAKILEFCASQGATDVAFLGGEPTMYHRITEAVSLAYSTGFSGVRIITNGTRPLTHFLRKYDGETKPALVFSIDGATKSTHERIRGANTFDILHSNIELAQKLEYRCAAITSISDVNARELLEILKLVDSYRFEYINVHYVSSRGFAKNQKPIDPQEWAEIRRSVVVASKSLSIPIRFERTFAPVSEFQDLPLEQRECEVRGGSNLMFFPDGKVYRCGLFVGENEVHSHNWDGQDLLTNLATITERTICEQESCRNCAGMNFISASSLTDRSGAEYQGICIYRKETIQHGRVYMPEE